MELDKKIMQYGDDYYNGDNTNIMERTKKIYTSDYGIVDDPFLSNHKVTSGFFKQIVDQKVNYLLGNGIQWVTDDEQEQNIDDYFEWNFEQILTDLATTASKKIVAWLYMYKDNGSLKFVEINPEQLEPIYNDKNELVEMRRRYKAGEQEILLVYDRQGYTKSIKKADEWAVIYQGGHYFDTKEFNGRRIEQVPLGFGVVPFIPLWNNKEHRSDLQAIKRHIDLYDIIMSDFGNNVDDMQDAFFTIRGHTATNSKELLEFVYNLKRSKIASVPENGDLQTNQLKVPVEARKELLSLLRKDIYSSAMAVNTDELSGGSITNVVIKAMFADLDLKCDKFESQIAKFIYTLIEYINRFDNKNYSNQYNLDRSLIMNQKEISERLINEYSIGAMSMQTLRQLLPIELNHEQEQEKLMQEDKDRIIRLEGLAGGGDEQTD